MQPSAYTDDVISELGTLIKGTRPDQMSDRTPCAKWTVHDLVNHLVGGGHMFAAAFRGESLPGTSDGMVALPFGQVPGQMAMDIAAVDLLIHSWDLAHATGQSDTPSPDLVETADAFAHTSIPPEARGGDGFAAEVPGPAGASSLERLIAVTGRRR